MLFDSRQSVIACLLCVLGFLCVKTSFAEEGVETYLATYCVGCHSAEAKESEFRIDRLSRKIGFEDIPQWREIIERVNSGEMPPKDARQQPSAETSATFVEAVADQLRAGEAAQMAARGRVTYNRLTRDEYVHTVRDLIGVQFDATDPGGFLEDPEWRGFERLGSVLTLAPSSIEKYLAAAEVILAEAYPEKSPGFLEFTKRAITENQVDEPHRTRLRDLGLLDQVRFEMWPGDLYRYTGSEPLPEAGIYEISYTLSGLKPLDGRAPRLLVYEEKLDRILHEQEVIAAEDAPIRVTFEAHLPKGRPSIMVINDVPGPSNNPRSGRHGRKPFLSLKDGRIPWQMKLTDEQGNARYPFLILDTVSMRGPLISEAERARRNEYMPTDSTELQASRAGLHQFARRAFRRPVSDAEFEPFWNIVQTELNAGEKLPGAIKASMMAILCSKSFLFLAEGDENSDRKALNDWEIANRLSYFLWSTMPDEALSDLAQQGKLSDPVVRQQQALRMLADPRVERFVQSFTTQWLQLRKVGKFQPDKKLYPEYDKHLEKSMVRETQAYFAEVLRKNLSLREFLQSDWTMVNQRLAEFYGLPSTELGDQFQRVSLSGPSHRGGLLTHASILSLTSDGTRHRPVHRGVWLSEVIFGKTPAPPPANVDPIEPNPVDAPKSTLRMKLEAHIHDARCAACHRKIDPLGLAFENYDAIGRWRTTEITDGTGSNPAVNPAGKLPDGRAFETPEAFKQLLLTDIDSFNETFTEKLAMFALRRAVAFSDRKAIQEIAAVSKGNNYQLRDVIVALVASDLFIQR